METSVARPADCRIRVIDQSTEFFQLTRVVTDAFEKAPQLISHVESSYGDYFHNALNPGGNQAQILQAHSPETYSLALAILQTKNASIASVGTTRTACFRRGS